jgi:hypothetical protein
MWHPRLSRWIRGQRERGLMDFQSTRRVNAVDWHECQSSESSPKCQCSMLFARAIGLTRKIDIINLAA